MSPNPAILTWPRPVDGAWTPADLTLVAWFDASDAATITSSGGLVSQWADKSGNARHFTQATDAAKPTTGSSIGSLNALSFDGTDWMTSSTASVWKILHDGTDYVIGIVAKYGETSAPGVRMTALATARGFTSESGMWIYWNQTNPGYTILDRVTNGSASPSASVLTANNFIAPNTDSVLTILADPDNATAANRMKLAADDGSVVGSNTETAAPSAGDAYGPLTVGALSNTYTIPLIGRMGEVVIATGADATEANRAKLATYLMTKWGIS